MDSILRQLIEEGEGQDEVELLIKLRPGSPPPSGVRIITRFGDIATCRLPRALIRETWESEAVVSLKGPRPVIPEIVDAVPVENYGPEAVLPSDLRRPRDTGKSGKGVVVGIIDWGLDFASEIFRDKNGKTRVLALWDQSSLKGPHPKPYGYGHVHYRKDIDKALGSTDPYATLGYHPGNWDSGDGAHGTVVAGIAAGGGTADLPQGVAPEADIVFVQMASRGADGRKDMGDDARILEAIDFISKVAPEKPLVINMSMGKMGGHHEGLSLVEQGLEAFLEGGRSRCICQSTGNYFNAKTHTSGRVLSNKERKFSWIVGAADATPNELEVWYSGRDKFRVALVPPPPFSAKSFEGGVENEVVHIKIQDAIVGSIYHRTKEPNTGKNHIDIFLKTQAPHGEWTVVLKGEDIVDGRYHAWIERDSQQSRFKPENVVTKTTTGTIANGFHTIAVGGFNAHSSGREPGVFSSSGPTADGRQKPELMAPGVDVLALRSTPTGKNFKEIRLYRYKGTSFAAPHVTGTVALLMERAARPLSVNEIRKALLSSVDTYDKSKGFNPQLGYGYLNIKKAIEAVGISAKENSGDGIIEEEVMVSGPLNEGMEETRTAISESAVIDVKAERCFEETSGVSGEHVECHDPTVELVEKAEEILRGNPPISGGGFLNRLAGVSGLPDCVEMVGGNVGDFAVPALIYDAFVSGTGKGKNRFFEVVAMPGSEVCDQLRPGDLLFRRGIDGANLAHVSMLTDGELSLREEFLEGGVKCEKNRDGYYARVVEAGPTLKRINDNFARFVADEAGRTGKDQLILRIPLSHPYTIARETIEQAAPVTVTSSAAVLPEIPFIASPNFSSRGGTDVDMIVLHFTANGSLDATVNWFKNPSAQVSAHYVIGKDGRIVQMVKEEDKAWHAGKSSWAGVSDCNKFSIGIEIVNWGILKKKGGRFYCWPGKYTKLYNGATPVSVGGEYWEPYSDKQYDALATLSKVIMKRHAIDIDRVVGHSDIAPGRKTDPGLAFDWVRFRKNVSS